MDANNIKHNRIIYLVTNRYLHDLHPKIENILTFRNASTKIVVVSRSQEPDRDHHIQLKTFPNPTGILSRLGLGKLRRLIDSYLYFPSTVARLVKPGIRAMSNHIEQDLDEGKEVVVMTSVPAHDLCQIGLSLKRRFPQIKWIIDWRDLWSYDEYYFERIPAIYRQRLLNQEKSFLAFSDLNITTNPYAQKVLQSQFGVPYHRTYAINQHYSQIDSLIHQERVKSQQSSNLKDKHNKGTRRIRLGFLGHPFKPPRVPGLKLIDTIKELRDKGVDVELHIYSPYKPKPLIPGQSVYSEGVFYHSRLSQAQNANEVAKCDFLVLLLENLENSRAVMSLKLPQYLLMQKPILAIVPQPSAVADVIEKTNTGFVIPANEDWAIGVEQMLRKTSWSWSFKPNWEAIEQFSWNAIKEEWFKVLFTDCLMESRFSEFADSHARNIRQS